MKFAHSLVPALGLFVVLHGVPAVVHAQESPRIGFVSTERLLRDAAPAL
ncbi:MAG: OmpH family outer membrane protein, partial [Actinobacteria bacterium]|nr:OmpH family outer membrane protein [Actinomycetota bacterium]